MMEHVSTRTDGASRSWKAYGYSAAGLTGIASFALFRSLAISTLITAGLAFFAAWLDALRHTVERQMSELAVARAHLQKGEQAAARRMSVDLAGRARIRRVRNGALTTAAWAALKEGNPKRAKEALDHIQPEDQIDLYCYAAVETALGKKSLAIEALELEVAPNCEAAMFLVDLYAEQGRLDRAVAAAVARRRVLGLDNCRKIVDAAVAAWALPAAETMATQLFEDTGSSVDARALVRVLSHQRQFSEVDRKIDAIVIQFRARGELSAARELLTSLSIDSTIPAGACRAIAAKLGELDLR
jgi:hypothetical protein